MLYRLTLLLTATILLSLIPAQSHAQTRLSPEEAEKLVIEKPDPVYPPIAKAIKAEGIVSIEIAVSEGGAVTSAKVKDGHPLLREAALGSARRLKYKPHTVDGKPVPFVTIVDFKFPPGASAPLTEAERKENERQDQLARLFFKQSDKCRNLVRGQKWKEAEQPCKEAVDTASQLTGDRALEKMDAYESFGRVMMGQSRFREALDFYARAYDVVRTRLTDTDAEMGSLYGEIAVAHHALGELDKAREMYRKAERSLQLAHENIGRDDPDDDSRAMQRSYIRQLKQLLEFHLIAAQQAGATAEIEEIRKLMKKYP